MRGDKETIRDEASRNLKWKTSFGFWSAGLGWVRAALGKTFMFGIFQECNSETVSKGEIYIGWQRRKYSDTQ